MLYTFEQLERSTGELRTVSLGDWITLTELGKQYGVGPRRVRTILRELDFVYAPAATPKASHRITPWVVKAGFGRRHEQSAKVKRAFDVISPAGQKWIAERWPAAVSAVETRSNVTPVAIARARLDQFKATRNGPMTAQQEVYWLVDHFPQLTQDQMASVIDVTRQLVSRHINIRAMQIAELRRRRDGPIA